MAPDARTPVAPDAGPPVAPEGRPPVPPEGRSPTSGAAPRGPGAAPSEPVVGPGARFEGTLAFRGEARVEGRVDGVVLARGTLHVAPGAIVCARIEAESLVVAGSVEGDVVAPAGVSLLAGARLVGDVRTTRLALADGSLLEGRCEMETGPGASAPPRG